jgi:hypothetical protein
MNLKYNDRDVSVDIEFEHGEGAYVTGGAFDDNGAELTEAQCLELEESNQEKLYEEGFQRAVMQAEAHADAMEDR